MREFEESLPPNGYRVRHLVDNDLGYPYEIGADQHAGGCYEIELVGRKDQGANLEFVLTAGGSTSSLPHR